MYVSMNTRVRATSESVMGDAEVQHQRHRARLVREVTRELDVARARRKFFLKKVFISFPRKILAGSREKVGEWGTRWRL